jgi:hypothetical protein
MCTPWFTKSLSPWYLAPLAASRRPFTMPGQLVCRYSHSTGNMVSWCGGALGSMSLQTRWAPQIDRSCPCAVYIGRSRYSSRRLSGSTKMSSHCTLFLTGCNCIVHLCSASAMLWSLARAARCPYTTAARR